VKNLNLAFVIGALALILTAVANAQGSGARHMRADIPFDFTLGDSTFKSGHYEVFVTWQGMIWLNDSEGQVKAIYSHTVNTGKDAEYSKLVFRHFGDGYFLAQVWMLGDSSGREIRPGRRQLEMMSRARSEPVDVMARK
jgi:hypothetical protein